MILLGQLFTLSDRQEAEGQLSWSLHLEAGHKIFKGHFPDNPILPGVCMMHIVKEALEQEFNTKLRVRKADQLKFLRIIDPRETPDLKLQVKSVKEEDGYKISASLNRENISFFKMSGKLEMV
ncbi:MAG: 3-hydroxyacyl-ACP dehydratase [Bacteroidia bacterium]